MKLQQNSLLVKKIVSYELRSFKNILLKSIQNTAFYNLSFDENLKSVMQSSKMNTGICYWNGVKNTVESRYIDSLFLQRLNAKMLLEKIKAARKELLSAVDGWTFF